VVGRRAKVRLRALNPIVGRGQRQFVLAVKVVEEASFGQTSRLADVLNPRGRISLDADHPDRSLQELGFRFVSRFGYRHFGTNQWVWGVLYRLVGMLIKMNLC
jgi:hypothetical protein